MLFSAVSGVTAAARCRIKDILALPELGHLFRDVLAETAAVGRAAGADLDPDIEGKLWSFVKQLPPEMRASTAVDLENGRPLEIDWVSGAAVRLGRKYGVATPANKALYAVLLPHKHGG